MTGSSCRCDLAGLMAPAKLNLSLRIVGRRANGYHELQSVFVLLDYGDRIDLHCRKDGAIRHLSPIPGVPAEQDLVIRAARLLKAESGVIAGVDIRLHKRLPLGGGLGGGSSDAATTLLGLNRAWGTKLDQATLQKLGLQLGADVPFFLQGHSAWVEGIGEHITPLQLPEAWYLVVKPDCEVATAAVFQHPQLTRDSARTTISDFLAGARGNDCQPLVEGLYPTVAEAARILKTFGHPRMTGTGSCIFLQCDSERQAREIDRQLPPQLSRFVAKSLNRSPLFTQLEASDCS